MRVNFCPQKWRVLLNPIEGLAWIYGKWFVNYQISGYLVACVIGASIMALLWTWGIDKYNEKHATQPHISQKQTVNIITHSATESATAEQMNGQTHVITGEYTIILPTAAVGYNSSFIASTSKAFSLDLVKSTDAFYLNGDLLAAGNKITSDGSIRATVHIIHSAINNCVLISDMIHCSHETINHSRCVNDCSWIAG